MRSNILSASANALSTLPSSLNTLASLSCNNFLSILSWSSVLSNGVSILHYAFIVFLALKADQVSFASTAILLSNSIISITLPDALASEASKETSFLPKAGERTTAAYNIPSAL